MIRTRVRPSSIPYIRPTKETKDDGGFTDFATRIQPTRGADDLIAYAKDHGFFFTPDPCLSHPPKFQTGNEFISFHDSPECVTERNVYKRAYAKLTIDVFEFVLRQCTNLVHMKQWIDGTKTYRKISSVFDLTTNLLEYCCVDAAESDKVRFIHLLAQYTSANWWRDEISISIQLNPSLIWILASQSLLLPHHLIGHLGSCLSQYSVNTDSKQEMAKMLETCWPLLSMYHPHAQSIVYDRLFWFLEDSVPAVGGTPSLRPGTPVHEFGVRTGEADKTLTFYDRAIDMHTEEEIYLATTEAVRYDCVSVLNGLYQQHPKQCQELWTIWMDAMRFNMINYSDTLRALCIVSRAVHCAEFLSNVLKKNMYPSSNTVSTVGGARTGGADNCPDNCRGAILGGAHTVPWLVETQKPEQAELIEQRPFDKTIWMAEVESFLCNCGVTRNPSSWLKCSDQQLQNAKETFETPTSKTWRNHMMGVSNPTEIEWHGQPGYRSSFSTCCSCDDGLILVEDIPLSIETLFLLTIDAICKDRIDILEKLIIAPLIAPPTVASQNTVHIPSPRLAELITTTLQTTTYWAVWSEYCYIPRVGCSYHTTSLPLFVIQKFKKTINNNDEIKRMKRQCDFFSSHIPQFKQSLNHYRRLCKERGEKVLKSMMDPEGELSLSFEFLLDVNIANV